MLPRIAVLIPTRNRWAKTQRFLTALGQQTYPNLAIVVADSHSTDGTPDLIQAEFPEVTVICCSDREFWAGAMNAAVRAALALDDATIDYLFTVNDDAVIAPTHVADLVNLAQAHQCDILGNQINYLDRPDRVWSLGTYTDWGSPRFLQLAYCDQFTQDIPADQRDRPVIPADALPGNGVLIHRRVFEAVGVYNDRWLPHYHADSEFTMRAAQAGFQPYVTPQVVLHNDFKVAQKQLNLRSLPGLWAAIARKKSHLYLPPLLYIFSRYCPPDQKWQTLMALGQRFGQLRQRSS